MKKHSLFQYSFGVVLALLALIVPGIPSAVLGAAYDRPNVTTKTNLTDQTAKVQEELWSRRVVLGADYQYQDNPFSGDFAGAPGSGKGVIKITDTEKVSGTVVNIPTIAGFGGPGVAGSGDRVGKEQKLQVGNFQVQIGRFWFGVGFQAVARDETVIGSRLDQVISDGLRQLHAKKRNDDILMSILQIPGTATGGRNKMFPDNITSAANLVSANTLDTGVLSKAKNVLSSLGALPMSMGPADSGGSFGENFVFFGTHHALGSLDTDPTYLDAVTNAHVRGSANPLFRGNYQEWNGLMLYRWYQRDHGNWGPIGSPLCPRAFLGAAITNGTTGTVVKGGGNATAAAVTPAPQYFEFFKNAPYTFYNGTTIAADAATTRHLMIINADGTGYGVYPYILNDGNQITISGAPLAIGVGTEVDDHPIGSLVVQCTIEGVTTGSSIIFGREMMACGTGSINGSKVSPQMGRRTERHDNHDMDHAIGAEGVWGCAAVKRADNIYPNVAIIEHAVSVLGAPVIT